MTSFFSTAFLNALKVGGTTSMTGITVRMYVFPQAPLFEENDSRYTPLTTITQLSSALGWGQYVSEIAPDNAALLNTTKPPNFYVTSPNAFDLPNAFPPTKPAALAFVYASGPDAAMVGKLMFTTNSTFLGESAILYNQDGLIPAPDTVNAGPTNNRWLMSWAIPEAGKITAAEGEIVIQRGQPPFEPARTQHVWMFPQRVNMIANPSFEAGTTHWKSTGAITRVSGGIDSAWYGHFAGANTIVESNTFPTRIRKGMDEGWTVQLTVRGNGVLKIGFVSWPAAYDSTACDWGPVEETWTLSNSWISVRTLRRAFDTSSALLRLETDGTFLDIDRVCVEPGWMPANGNDWPYFDGDSTFGALDDFSWYGNKERTAGSPSRVHKSYSCWYNHRRAVTGRLFQWSDPDDEGPGSVFTDEEVAEQGLVFGWVPAGTPVEQHLDVLYTNDPRAAVPDVAGPTTPRATGPTDYLGVPDPWL